MRRAFFGAANDTLIVKACEETIAIIIESMESVCYFLYDGSISSLGIPTSSIMLISCTIVHIACILIHSEDEDAELELARVL